MTGGGRRPLQISAVHIEHGECRAMLSASADSEREGISWDVGYRYFIAGGRRCAREERLAELDVDVVKQPFLGDYQIGHNSLATWRRITSGSATKLCPVLIRTFSATPAIFGAPLARFLFSSLAATSMDDTTAFLPLR